MKLALAAVALFAFLTGAQTAITPPSDPASKAGDVARREADVQNYLTTRLRLVKRGAALDELKAEVMNDVDFGALSPRSVDLFRRMVKLCDEGTAKQAKLKGDLGVVDDEIANGEATQMSSLAGLVVGAATSSSLVQLLAFLPGVADRPGARTKRAALLEASAAELGAEVSAFEFELALLRADLLTKENLDPAEFVYPADYDQFLAAAVNPKEEERIAGVATALERSPRLEPAALHLCNYFFTRGDDEQCDQAADKTIKAAPRILRRDALRAQAYAYKAHIALKKRDYSSAVALADLGLQDDPGSVLLLVAKAWGLALNENYHDSLPLLEKLVLLVPADPTVRYNLACCYARDRRDADATLACFRAALERGLTDIAYARSDPDLELLRRERASEFDELTSLRLGFTLDPQVSLFPTSLGDGLIVTNQSAFSLAKVKLLVRITSKVRGSQPSQRTFELDPLAPGQSQNFPCALPTAHHGFESIYVAAEGQQGRFEKVLTPADLKRR